MIFIWERTILKGIIEAATFKNSQKWHNPMNALKYQTTIKDGQLDLPPIDLPEGTVVEAILLIKESNEIDETDYLLSTKTNRRHLKEAVELLKNPDNYVYVDPAKL